MAKKEGWYYRESGVAGQRQLKQHGNNVEKRLEATINTGSYPYMDTLYMGFKTAKGKKLVISNDPHAGARHDKKFVMQFTNQHNENHFKEMTLEKCHCCGDGLYREIVKHRGPDSAYLCLPCFTTELVVPVLSTVQQYKKDCVFSKFYNGFVLKTQLVTVDTGECAGKELHSYDIIKLDNKTYSIRELGNFAAEQGLEESYEILAQKFRKHLKV